MEVLFCDFPPCIGWLFSFPIACHESLGGFILIPGHPKIRVTRVLQRWHRPRCECQHRCCAFLVCTLMDGAFDRCLPSNRSTPL